MIGPIAAVFCFLVSGICGFSEIVINDIDIDGNMVDMAEQRGNLGWPRIFEVFEVCEVTCQGKSCRCCHHVLNVVPALGLGLATVRRPWSWSYKVQDQDRFWATLLVCGALYIDPTTKMAEISLTLTGRTAFSAVFSIIPFLNFCHTSETKLGEVDLCGNATISEHKTNPDSFKICIEGEVQLNKVKHLHVIVNCLEFNGDLIFESDDNSVPGKNIASIRIHNQIILVNVIRKALTDSIIG